MEHSVFHTGTYTIPVVSTHTHMTTCSAGTSRALRLSTSFKEKKALRERNDGVREKRVLSKPLL